MAKKSKKKQTKAKTLPLPQTIFLLIIGVFLGTVFTFGTAYWYSDVTPDACITVDAHFSDYKITRKHYYVECSDGNTYEIRYKHRDDNVKDKLPRLTEGESIRLLIHPDSNIVLSFTTATDTVVTFENATSMMKKEFAGFMSIGIFMYFSALLGLYSTIHHIIKWTKNYNSLSKK